MKTFYSVKNIRHKIPFLITEHKQEALELAKSLNAKEESSRGWLVHPLTEQGLKDLSIKFERESKRYLEGAEMIYLALEEAGVE
jgi:hypothetical protein